MVALAHKPRKNAKGGPFIAEKKIVLKLGIRGVKSTSFMSRFQKCKNMSIF